MRPGIVLRRGDSGQTIFQGQSIDEINESSSLSVGAIVGIATGGVCLLLICSAAICFLMRSSKSDENRVIELDNTINASGHQQPNMDNDIEAGIPNHPEISE